MTFLRPVRLVIALIPLVVVVCGMPPQDVTTRRSSPMGETIQRLTNQLMELNATSDIILDTRTPPKIKQQMKKHDKNKQVVENSHAGVAVPIEDDAILEETTKKAESKATTSGGLSTWVLLSGNTSPPITTTKKPPMKSKPEGEKNTTVVETPKNPKPMFKKRPTTTTKRPTVATTPDNQAKFTRIKASILNNAKNKTTVRVENVTTPMTPLVENKTESPLEKINTLQPEIKPEAKEGELDLATTKKPRRPTNKRKKNKNRRKRPAMDRTANSTKLATKEKPISTQIYNYFSREVMPTVGVGLVGLMVTAGLASYFLYPFGIARRSYEVDRKDKEGAYYYDDYAAGGVAEEEVIGKVIAGMPDSYQRYNVPSRYRHVDQKRKTTQGTVESVHLTPSRNEDFYTRNYKDVIEQSKESGYTVDDKRFVVGNVPTEVVQEITPVVVPEHGPRSLRRRRAVMDEENEIIHGDDVGSTPPSTDLSQQKPQSFLAFLADLFTVKIKLGLEMLQNSTASISKYLNEVQKRFDENNNKTLARS